MPKEQKPEAKAIIVNVIKVCEAEKNEGRNIIPLKKPNGRVASLTGKSLRTIMRIRQEMAKIKPPPPKKSRGCRPEKFELDDLKLCEIRHTIMRFYHTRGCTPSVRTVLPVMVKEHNFDGSRELLRHILHSIGYTFKTMNKNKRMVENYEIASSRMKYLRQIHYHRSNHLQSLIYITELTVKLNKNDEAPHWNILYATPEENLNTNLMMVYKYNKTEEKCCSNFSKWLKESFLPSLNGPKTICLPQMLLSRTQTNKSPMITDSKAKIRDWLMKNNIPFSQNSTKVELLGLVTKNKQPPVYELDGLLRNLEHSILVIPQNHSDLNPLDILWNKIKVNVSNISDAITLNALNNHIVELFKNVDIEEWIEVCKIVKENECKYLKDDQLIEKCIA